MPPFANSDFLSRRDWLEMTTGLAVAAGAGLLSARPANALEKTPMPASPSYRYSFNTSTIMGQKLPLLEQIDVAGKAGFHAFEPWMRDLQQFVDGGGKLADARKKIADYGMTMESAIGFAQWIVDDETQRKAGLDALKHDMDQLVQMGGKRIAAPPIVAQDASAPKLDPSRIAERYHAALEVGRNQGIVPQLELWGFSKNLSRMSEVLAAAAETDHPDACILPDIYHLHRGGSSFEAMKLLAGASVHVFHVNDYPGSKAADKLVDADRVYPGDGDAPIAHINEILKAICFNGVLSLELFNQDLWKQDPYKVAVTGMEKMKKAFPL